MLLWHSTQKLYPNISICACTGTDKQKQTELKNFKEAFQGKVFIKNTHLLQQMQKLYIWQD